MSMKNIMDRILDKTTSLTEVATEIRESYRQKRALGTAQFEPRNDGKVFVMEQGELFSGHWYKYKDDAEVYSRIKMTYEVMAECACESILVKLKELRKDFCKPDDLASIPMLVDQARVTLIDYSERVGFGDLHHHLPDHETIEVPQTSLEALALPHVFISVMAFYFPEGDSFDIIAGVGRWVKIPGSVSSDRDVFDYKRFCTD